MTDVKVNFKVGALGPLEVSDLRVLRAAIQNAIEVSGSSSDIDSLERSFRYISSVIEDATTPGR